MSELIAPLTSPDCDLRDFPFMQIDVVRLRDSDLAAMESPDACWAAVLLWCASWHQIPAASLPDDDRVLANLAGFGRVVKEWSKIRTGALRGWIKCSDGRLYHPVVAEKANDAFNRKLAQGWRTECARIKKHNQRQSNPSDHIAYQTLEEYLSRRTITTCPEGQDNGVPRDKIGSHENVPRETSSRREGEGDIKPINQSTNAGEPDKFAMRVGWQPSEHVSGLAKQSGTPLLDCDLPEFVAHWMTEPVTKRTQAEWDKALLQSAKHRKLRGESPLPAKGKSVPQSFAEKDYGTEIRPL